MKKELWNQPFTEHRCPPWPCPVCESGTLVLIPGMLREKFTKESMKDINEDWWDSSQIVLSFTAWAKCNNADCSEEVAFSGTGTVEQVLIDPDSGESAHLSVYSPHSFQPSLDFFKLPEKCPAEVKESLTTAFAVYWRDKPAAAGRIRVATERLLDHLEVPKQTDKGKRLTLGKRIELYQIGGHVYSPHLQALRWLGNVGSHTSKDSINANDLLDAFGIFEYLLEEVIGERSAKTKALAAKLTEKFGDK